MGGMTAAVVASEMGTAIRSVILADPTFQGKFLTPNFFEPIVGSADAFASYVKAEQARWSKILADNKLSAE